MTGDDEIPQKNNTLEEDERSREMSNELK